MDLRSLEQHYALYPEDMMDRQQFKAWQRAVFKVQGIVPIDHRDYVAWTRRKADYIATAKHVVGSRCECCSQDRPLVADRDPITDKLRGVVCRSCSTDLKRWPTVDWIDRAIECTTHYLSSVKNLDADDAEWEYRLRRHRLIEAYLKREPVWDRDVDLEFNPWSLGDPPFDPTISGMKRKYR